jgi:catechol 2,3-dioxygenase-like lactoylglutathione lyase family enzyme
MKQNIVGIQQVGVGIPDVHKAWAYYRKHFGMDIPIFQESAEAKLMTPYTGGKVHSRSAVLAINIKGGSGLEIWQFTSRATAAPKFDLQLGDYGIMISKVKAHDVSQAFEQLKRNGALLVGGLHHAPDGALCFYVKDEFGSLFQVVQGKDWFRKGEHVTGGVCGAVIGVSDIEKSKKFYGELLGYDHVMYDKTDVFEDFKDLPGGAHRMRRVLLGKSKENTGNFSKLLGSSHIELIQVLDRTARKIFEDRFWGDLGFIHLCFDVYNMKELE